MSEDGLRKAIEELADGLLDRRDAVGRGELRRTAESAYEEVARHLRTALAENPDDPEQAKTEGVEIVNGWLVETGHGNYIPGYGIEPGSDAMPLLDLSKVPGWMTFSEEAIERAAKRLFEREGERDWDQRSETLRNYYRADIRAVVAALRGEA